MDHITLASLQAPIICNHHHTTWMGGGTVGAEMWGIDLVCTTAYRNVMTKMNLL